MERLKVFKRYITQEFEKIKIGLEEIGKPFPIKEELQLNFPHSQTCLDPTKYTDEIVISTISPPDGWMPGLYEKRGSLKCNSCGVIQLYRVKD